MTMGPRDSYRPDAARGAGGPPADDDRDPVERLAEEFIARRRRGESATIDEYAARCPERADEIRDLFPTILAMEHGKPGPESTRIGRNGPGPDPIGRLGDCRLIREIGRGGMGV